MPRLVDPNDEVRRTIQAELRTRESDTIRNSVGVDEAANLLGISPSTLRRRIKAGDVAVSIIGGRTLISKDELRRLFKR